MVFHPVNVLNKFGFNAPVGLFIDDLAAYGQIGSFQGANSWFQDKGKEKLQAVIEKDPLALIEYGSVDPDYDGETFRSKWQDYRDNTSNDSDPHHIVLEAKLKVTHSLNHKRKICVKAVDVFGFESVVVKEI